MNTLKKETTNANSIEITFRDHLTARGENGKGFRLTSCSPFLRGSMCEMFSIVAHSTQKPLAFNQVNFKEVKL